MKREKDLYDKICDINTIKVACKFASRGKKNRKTVLRTLEQEEKKMAFLQQLLKQEEYNPLPYNKKTIQDRCTNKIREIFVPRFFPDQIVQWSLMLVIKPILMKGMYDFCCASVDGRGSGYGIKAIKKWITLDQKNTKYCLICDIKKFYPNINQDLLIKKFERKIKDTKTLNLIIKIIRSVPSGLPIGNFTSQWFANFFLQDFDHFVKEKLKIKHYLRYMDDMVFFGSNKRELGKKREEIQAFLEKEDLKIKENWQIFKIADEKNNGRPLDILGYRFYRNYITMRPRTFLRATRRLRRIANKEYLTAKDSCAVMSYVARAKIMSGQKFYLKFVKDKINLKECRKKISVHDRKLAKLKKDIEKGDL